MAKINCEKYAKSAFGTPFSEKDFFSLYECLSKSNFVFKALKSFRDLSKEDKEDIFHDNILSIYDKAKKGGFKWDKKISQFSTYFNRILVNSANDRKERKNKEIFNADIHPKNSKIEIGNLKRINNYNPILVASNNSIYFSKIKYSDEKPDFSIVDRRDNPILRHVIITYNINMETVQKIIKDFKNNTTFKSLNLLKTRYSCWHSAK